MDFADTDDAVLVARNREFDPPRSDGAFKRFTGVHAGGHAGGHDFGPRHSPPRPQTGPGLTPDEEEALIEAAFGTQKRYETAKAAVARGELDAIERRSWQRGLSAALTLEEAADWLDVGTGRVLTQLAFGELFAFDGARFREAHALFPTRLPRGRSAGRPRRKGTTGSRGAHPTLLARDRAPT